jgi:hypothetical protein
MSQLQAECAEQTMAHGLRQLRRFHKQCVHHRQILRPDARRVITNHEVDSPLGYDLLGDTTAVPHWLANLR